MRLLMLLACVIAGTLPVAQAASITTGQTATDLINELMGGGGGITINSSSVTGDASARGIFSGASGTGIGFDSGFVLGSGNVGLAFGTSAADTILNTAGDTDLEGISGVTSFDASILEFTFTPSGSQVTFKYRYASEEYPNDYAGQYFDVFAFFVNGVNKALLPDGVTAVGVKTINPTTNTAYYVSNPGNSPINSTYDGFSTELSFTANVNPGVPNTIKIAICDGGDATLDSAVFIQGGSFRVNSVPTVANALVDQSVAVGQALSYQFAANSFNDADAGDTLTYSATLNSGAALPGWLGFNAGTRTFSGTPAVGNVGTIDVKVTASDGAGSAATDVFQITVNNKTTPNVTTWPSATGITYGQALSDSTLSGGAASVPGTFSFTTPATTPNAGTYSASVTFTPTDTTNYNNVVGSVNVAVAQITPNVTTWPSATGINYGQALSASTLSGGAASVPGSFAFTTPATTPNAGTYSASVTFTPTDSTNYSNVVGSVNVAVAKITPTVTTWASATGITYGQALSASTLSGGSTSTPGTFSFDAPATTPNAGSYSAAVTFTPTDTTNYNTVGGSVNVNVAKATPTVPTWPTGSSITYGQQVGASTLSGGAGSVAGSFAFDTPTQVLGAGSHSVNVIFWPTDSANYQSLTGSVTLTVNKATPSVTTWPNASAITYGQTLNNSVLSGGVSVQPGLFSFDTPTSVPLAGTQTAGVKFTPIDTTNYEIIFGTAQVTVNKATPNVTAWPTATGITYGDPLTSSTLSGGTASVPGTFAFTNPSATPAAGTPSISVTFTPTDSANYNTVTGSVTVAVAKATPSVTTWPTASAIQIGQMLGDSTLSGAASSVPGTFTFDDPTSAPAVGTYTVAITFTPTDSANYNIVTGTVQITVTKVLPNVTTWPTATGITYGQTLADSTLSGGAASVPGTFAFDDPTSVPLAGTPVVAVTFTPTDTASYETVAGTVGVAVAKATPNVTTWPTASQLTYGEVLGDLTLTSGTASVPGTFTVDDPTSAPTVGTYTVAVTFTPTDTANYNTVAGTAEVVVVKATPTVTAWPTASDIVYGDTLADSTLSTSTTSVPGTFAFDNPTTAPAAGLYLAAVTFTPTDTDNYNTVAGTVQVGVARATPTVTTWPVASQLTYGQTVADSTLSSGTASMPGTFSFDEPTSAPTAGTHTAAVTFTPTDSDNYNTVAGTVQVVVIKATPTVTTWPVASQLTYGQTLADSMLSSGTASVPGSFSFDDPTSVPLVGTHIVAVTFTPTDSANYNTVAGTVEVVVIKATPTVTTWPVASSIDAGDTLADSMLTSGTASVPGSFSFDAPTSAPAVGTHIVAVTFTPTDTANYNTVAGTVEVEVEPVAPETIGLTPATILENRPAGTQVGLLSCTPRNVNRTYTFSLVAGTGDTDNALFTIQGDQLRTAGPLDYETQASYSVRVRVAANTGESYTTALAVSALDDNDAPLDILLSNSIVATEQTSGSLVGQLSAVDQDTTDSHSFALVAGAGDNDNARFQITGNGLRTLGTLPAGTQGPLSIRVRTQDLAGATLDRQFSIAIKDPLDTQAPTFTVKPVVLSVGETSALLQWETNEPATAQVHYGIAPQTNLLLDVTTAAKQHQVQLTGLTSGTLYRVQVGASDLIGNGPTLSPVLEFTTLLNTPVVPLVIVEGPLATSINETSAEIRWSTSAPANSRVRFSDGTVIGVREEATLSLQHSIVLAGLTPATLYSYRVESVDAQARTVQAGPLSFATLAAPDTTAPQITEGPLTLATSNQGATVAWKTDEPATSLLELRVAGTTETQQLTSTELTRDHQLVLNGLLAGTSYEYRVQAYDIYGNGPRSSGWITFRTAALADVTPPRILSGPTVQKLTNTMAAISWTTDEPADSVVHYGQGLPLDSVQSNPTLVTEHQVTLVNLVPDTFYLFQVFSTDAAGNTIASLLPVVIDSQTTGKGQAAGDPLPAGSFVTDALPDATAPQFLSGPQAVSISDTQAIIIWSTDEIGDARVEYGRQADGLDHFTGDITRRLTQYMILTNLLPGTTYVYRVGTQDLAGNLTTSTQLTFTTLAAPDTEAPDLLNGPAAQPGLTTARITWGTSELGTSQVVYGLTSAALTEAMALTGIRTTHTLDLANLSEGTEYFYRVISQDPAGNVLTSPVNSFVTDSSIASLDLSVTAQLSAPTATNGALLDATFTVINTGTTSATDTVLTVTLPSRLLLQSVATSATHTLATTTGSCVITFEGLPSESLATVVLHLMVDPAAEGPSQQLPISGQLSTEGPLWSDPNPANNTTLVQLQFNVAQGTIVIQPTIYSLAPSQPPLAWELTGPGLTMNGTGDETIANAGLGTYTVIWTPRFGWTSPSKTVLTLTENGQQLTFAANYRPDVWTCLGMDLPNGQDYATSQTVLVQWRSEPLVTGSAVAFELWQGDQKVADLGTAWEEDCAGEIALALPDVVTGYDYRIRMYSVWDRAFWIPSAPLRVLGRNAVDGNAWQAYE